MRHLSLILLIVIAAVFVMVAVDAKPGRPKGKKCEHFTAQDHFTANCERFANSCIGECEVVVYPKGECKPAWRGDCQQVPTRVQSARVYGGSCYSNLGGICFCTDDEFRGYVLNYPSTTCWNL